MMQTNLQNRMRLTDLENELTVAKGKGQGLWEGHVHTAIFKMDNQQGPTYCIAHESLLYTMWQPGWEGSLGENGYMCMHG